MSELTLATVATQLNPKQKLLVSEETIEEVNKLANDPEYGEEFLTSYMDHLQVLADAPSSTHRQYVNAVKFFSLVESGNTLTDAYIKVFPDRYESRRRHYEEGEDGKEIIRKAASRYNGNKMVNEIRRIATTPVQLIHRHLLHEAILETAKLMTNSKSDMVRQRAADTLIRELKPAEDANLNIKVDDNTGSVIKDLAAATQKLAAQQKEAVLAGVPMKHIAAARIYESDEEIIDVEPDPA